MGKKGNKQHCFYFNEDYMLNLNLFNLFVKYMQLILLDNIIDHVELPSLW